MHTQVCHYMWWLMLIRFIVVKWKWKSLSHVQLFATLWTIQSMEFSRPEYWGGSPFLSPGDLPFLRTEPRSPTLQADSLPAEPPGKSKNTGVGSLSLLQGIFPTQGLNQRLLYCRRILYQLSHQGNPFKHMHSAKPTDYALMIWEGHCGSVLAQSKKMS